MKKILSSLLIIFIAFNTKASTPEEVIKKVKAKLETVNDYVAEGSMKTQVVFIKAPVGKVKVYYKKPGKMKLVKDKGISILPKGGFSFNTSTILGLNDIQILDAGTSVVGGITTRVLKLLPNDENSEVVITTLYIDTANFVIKKSATTTKENGSFEMEMTYGKYIANGLPDKMIFSFNVKNYKMPKGVTLDFDTETKPEEKEKLKNKKGKVEITYSNYIINKGVDDNIFKN